MMYDQGPNSIGAPQPRMKAKTEESRSKKITRVHGGDDNATQVSRCRRRRYDHIVITVVG